MTAAGYEEDSATGWFASSESTGADKSAASGEATSSEFASDGRFAAGGERRRGSPAPASLRTGCGQRRDDERINGI